MQLRIYHGKTHTSKIIETAHSYIFYGKAWLNITQSSARLGNLLTVYCHINQNPW